MKKLDKGDKMIIASVILAIGIAIGAYFIANPKSELEKLKLVIFLPFCVKV